MERVAEAGDGGVQDGVVLHQTHDGQQGGVGHRHLEGGAADVTRLILEIPGDVL